VEIRAGYDIAFQCFQDTPMTLMLSIDPARVGDLLSEHSIQFSPNIPSRDYVDMFGNTCTRIVAPAGLIEMRNDFLIADRGLPDEVALEARQLEVGDLPDDMLVYLLGSRYCDTQKLSALAWSLFGGVTPGWQRVQAICDYAHDRICFGYEHARCDRTASEGHEERVGVCRDFAHLAVTLCRCMNILRVIARATSATSVSPSIRRQWISAHGSRPISTADGLRSTPVTTIPGSAGS
jgi:transglutaminase-like putative cysteine protease